MPGGIIWNRGRSRESFSHVAIEADLFFFRPRTTGEPSVVGWLSYCDRLLKERYA